LVLKRLQLIGVLVVLMDMKKFRKLSSIRVSMKIEGIFD
jgi:hypothetical protein